MNKRTVYKVMNGSRVYGTAVVNSDIDTIETYVPLDSESLFCITSGWKDGTQTIDEFDARTYDVRYFCSLASRGQTSQLESMFLKPEHIIECHDLFKPILNNKDLFLFSQMNIVGPAYGYAVSERKSMFGLKTGNMGAARKKAFEKFGYNPKSAHHGLRILGQTLHCLNTGTYSPYPVDHQEVIEKITGIGFGDWLDYLVAVKLGVTSRISIEHVFDTLMKELELYHVQFNKDTKLSFLPLEKDSKKIATINELLGELLIKIVKEPFDAGEQR